MFLINKMTYKNKLNSLLFKNYSKGMLFKYIHTTSKRKRKELISILKSFKFRNSEPKDNYSNYSLIN